MKNTIKNIFLMLLIAGAGLVSAQTVERTNKSVGTISPFDKKFRWGISGNQYWGTIRGKDLTDEYFAKPCLGFNIRAEYFPVSFIGISIGGGIQQRGAGIITPDYSGGSFTHPWESPIGDADSTYRRRLRFLTYEIPVSILLRSPKDLIKGVRPSVSAGFSMARVRWVNDVFQSPEDGFHTTQVVSEDYLRRDLAVQLTAGVDIDAGGGGVLQVHLVYACGTRNVYASGQGDGRLNTYGFRLSWLY